MKEKFLVVGKTSFTTGYLTNDTDLSLEADGIWSVDIADAKHFDTYDAAKDIVKLLVEVVKNDKELSGKIFFSIDKVFVQ